MQGYPQHGGDVAVMAEVDRIVKECGGTPVAPKPNTRGCYVVECVCGSEIVSANPTGVCLNCGRGFVLDHRGDYALRH